MSKVRVDTIADLNDDAVISVVELVNRVSSAIGPKAVAPTVRNDGSALAEGDTYFNTATHADMTYVSGAWSKTVTVADILDVLSSTATDKALSAKQGKALLELIQGASMPIGMTYPWTLSEASIPAGGIARNGQLLSRATWPQLWALVSSQAISDAVWLAAPYDQRGKYSTGDGSTTFRMPDDNAKHADGNTIAAVTYRGYGKNSTGVPGTHQADQLQDFELGYWTGAGSFNLHTVASDAASGQAASATLTPATMRINLATAASAYNTPIIPMKAGSYTEKARVGTETRMTNSTVIWVTVGANLASSPGTVDVNSLATNVATNTGKIAVIEAKQVLTKEYISTPQTISSGGTLTLAHGFGVKPKIIKKYLVCTVATGNWAVGDEFVLETDYEQANASLVLFGYTCKRDVTNLVVRFASAGIFALDPLTGGLIASTTVATNFKIVFEAWA